VIMVVIAVIIIIIITTTITVIVIKSVGVCERNELTAVRKELQTRQMQMIAETEKYVSCERRAYSAEQQLAALQSNNVRLQVHIDKLRMKYEPGSARFAFFLWTFWTGLMNNCIFGKVH